MQCGFCTPGIVCSLMGLLARDPAPSEEAIMDTLNGHLCRCTGYQNIVKAARQAAGRPVESSAFESSAFESSAFESTAFESSAFESSAFESSAFESSAPESIGQGSDR
jgi:xanthine dehydrogenase iron-sulfur cluster and FAD-binding subunit A